MPDFIIYTGPMFSGKSTRLNNVLSQKLYTDDHILFFRPRIDTRKYKKFDSTRVEEYYIDTFRDIINIIKATKKTTNKKISCFIDELQFVELKTVKKYAIDSTREAKYIYRYMYENGVNLYMAGLNLDVYLNPFETVQELSPFATVYKFMSVCANCKRHIAIFSHRRRKSTDRILIGGKKEYSALCSSCYFKEKKESYE